MRLSELVSCIPFYEWKGPTSDPIIHSISHHHKSVKQGTLFIALKGEKRDGRDFIQQAVLNGAAAVLCDIELSLSIPVIQVKNSRHALAQITNLFYGYPSYKMNVIGITGTNGKTTVSHMIQSIVDYAGEKTGVIGTLYMKQGAQTKTSINTTPDSLLLQQTLSDFLAHNVTTSIIEVSSHGLAQGRLFGCDIDIAVFTNLTQDHLDYHGTMDHYRWSKSLLFSQLGHNHFMDLPKFAIVNDDDPFSEMIRQATSAHIISYGLNERSDVYASKITYGRHSTAFTAHTPIGTINIKIPVVGVFNVYNALASIAATFAKRIPLSAIAEGLKNMQSVPGRFEIVEANQPFTIIVDYAHTPDSLENVLQAIVKMRAGRTFVVVGCGGDRDKTKRPLMAKVACGYGTDVIFTADNPRSEDPADIIKDMEEGVPGHNYSVILDRKEAIAYAISQAKEDDVILIAGKGHEKVQIIGNDLIPFDDKEVAFELVKGAF
ncbi:UDP-N-acetylmuramoyl-L-alanyl-D-glutamate--2,6-diaminopimelate ligase [Jeotgalibacillus proteolyticus]|uniref:UDP-N-acetylmuramoyl-L-alanyl-D-glutamate--2,6-diaminopimelate ligase n=1 Tax=Jeotgalibacillus proteolyticus TaxID=2082395 RepID=A0A2S5GHN8_9BACL|nr:UDP-N-acetylmuramoyl-L-alanyl-D-glutamate--2,6-diaminopimelate ligase [Jeotgalibacillus proteolyticus]PPA72486.1 UDP-N-acetylmuramoyl-L-alanyl-D-glutamate--2,6-diaminopimelate ligase [Jeotgalibacillus proteolyticus]